MRVITNIRINFKCKLAEIKDEEFGQLRYQLPIEEKVGQC
jgi:hypothetical protein